MTDAVPSAPPATVFVSYSRTDQKRALPLIRALEGAGYQVWWDGLLEAGDTFLPTTEAALESAQAVVVLWSQAAVTSHWVRDEATRGRDRRCLVPLSLDGSEPPLGFRQFQVTDFSRWKGKHAAPEFQKVLRTIESLAGRPPQVPLAPPPASRISRRMAIGSALAVLTAGGALASWRLGLLGPSAAANSVAVLPFRNLSGDPAQDYFSDGLSEELRATLSRNPQLAVMAETSSNTFREARQGAQKIAQTLGVAFILEGSVRRGGDAVRITAQLVDGKTGFEKWSQTFDRTLDRVLEVQSDIATIVADALAASLLLGGKKPSERIGGTRNTQAFDAYLRGRALYKLAADEASDRGALALYDKALALDPKFAAAQVGRSVAHTAIASTWSRGDQVKTHVLQAIAAANAAIQLAPDLAEAHSALGFVLLNGKLDVRGAQVPFQKSFELGSGNASVLVAYAEYAAFVGRFEEGRLAIERARQLDPLNSAVFRIAGLVEFYARNLDGAQTAFRTALSLNPKSGIVHRYLGDIALAKGKAGEARALYAQEPFDMLRLPGLAIADMRLSNPAAAEQQLAGLVGKYGNNSLYQQAEVLAQWGRPAEALTAIEQAYEAGDAGLVTSRYDPLLDPIRQDPRFVTILRKLGFN